jgi:nucleotide-binding universal stress UspA family protein
MAPTPSLHSFAAMEGESGLQGPILIAYDGSEEARKAITFAATALGPGRKALVATAWQPIEAVPVGGIAWPATMNVDPQLEESARKTAEKGRGLAEAAGFSASTLVERGAPVWRPLVQAAEREGAVLIVMGSRGRSGIAGVLLGSVAEGVSRHSDRPVLIVH